jgi:nucleoside phosphorylase
MAPKVDFLIVVALEEERDAVLSRLAGYTKHKPTQEDIRIYYSAEVPVTFSDDSHGVYQVVVVPLLGMGRIEATAATSDALRRWRPRYVVLVGIAGGVSENNISLGDVVISDQIVDYELQKITAAGPEIRWQVFRSDPRLIGAAQNYQDTRWADLARTTRPRNGQPLRHIGPIASGDKIVAMADVLTKYRAVWPKLIGVEMEAAGVALASFQASSSPGFLMVRGISDYADENKGRPRTTSWRLYACDIAAAFLLEFLKSGPVPLARGELGSSNAESLRAQIQERLYKENGSLPNVLTLCMDLVRQVGNLGEYEVWLRKELNGFDDYDHFKDSFDDPNQFAAWMQKWATHRMIDTYLKMRYRPTSQLGPEIQKLPFKKVFITHPINGIVSLIETAKVDQRDEMSVLLRDLGSDFFAAAQKSAETLSPGMAIPHDLQLFYRVSELDRILNGVREKILALLGEALG